MEGYASFFVYTCLCLLFLFIYTRNNVHYLCSSSSSLSQDPTSCNSSLLHSSRGFPIPYTTTTVNNIRPRRASHLQRVEYGLARARWAIREAARTRTYGSYKDGDFLPSGSLYLNPYAFHQLRS